MSLYTYRARIVEVHDGDTVTVSVDLGFRIARQEARVRLAGVSARELSAPGGRDAAWHLAELLPVGSEVTIRSIKAGRDPADVMSFDRYVIVVTLPDGRDLAQVLIDEGWAVAWDGKSRPVPYPPWPRPVSSNPVVASPDLPDTWPLDG